MTEITTCLPLKPSVSDRTVHTNLSSSCLRAACPDLAFRCDGDAASAHAIVILAHGAGAGMDSDFLTALSKALAARGLFVVSFEFAYMVKRRLSGNKRPPAPKPILLANWAAVLECTVQCSSLPVVVAGKSMGGRIGSELLASASLSPLVRSRVAGCMCYGYPFHPPAKQEQLRTEHLAESRWPERIPLKIVQGTRDPFGKPDEVANYSLAKEISIAWLESGDHDFVPLRRSGFEQRDLIQRAADLSIAFIEAHLCDGTLTLPRTLMR